MSKNIYQELIKDEKAFTRISGLKRGLFEDLYVLIAERMEEQKEAYPMRRRGRKTEMSLEDKLLLMLIYYREYYTCLSLSKTFGISEAYASKLIHRMGRLVAEALPLGGKRTIHHADIKAVLIDASEQTIERPQRKQRAYYSGKKNSYHQSSTGGR
jgi:Helix-turn-helix of DDE superfamily endonuclease